MNVAPKRLTQSGIIHHVLMAGMVFVVGFALIGTFELVRSNAQSKASTIVGIGGKCLDNLHGTKANYNSIDLASCSSTARQNWTVNGTAMTAGTIVNSNGYCLDVYHSLTVNYTKVDLYGCNGGVGQAWTYNSATGQIKNPHSGKCLDDFHSLTATGNKIDIYKCNNTKAQKWTVKNAVSTPTPTPAPSPTPTPTPTPTPIPAPKPTSSVSCDYQVDTWSGDASKVGYSVTKVSASDGNPASFSVKLNANKGTTEVVGYPSEQCILYSALPTNLNSSFTNTPPASSSGLDYEYAYDIWLTTATAAKAANWNTDLELMIWTYVNGQVPAGSVKATLADGSKVWVAGNNTTGTVSVVLPKNETSGNVNISSIVTQLKSLGYVSNNYGGILDTEYGIEAPYGGGQTFTVGSLSVAD